MLGLTKSVVLAFLQEQPQILVPYIQITPQVVCQTNVRNLGLSPVPSCPDVENKPK